MNKTYRSFAKVNLHLQVVGLREDGYHELRTVFQSIDLADRVTIELAGSDLRLTTEGLDVPGGEENLACAAAELFRQRWARDAGIRIHLEKRIPVGGGLGGGSANAGTVLLALRDMLGRPESVAELLPLARELGSDVPFFLVGGLALGVGRGDEVIALPDRGEETLWLADPGVLVRTAEIYRSLEGSPSNALSPAVAKWLSSGSARGDPLSHGRNDLEAPAMARHPQIRQVYNVLRRAGAEVVRVSGSGGCVVARLPAEANVEQLRGSLPSDCQLTRVRTLSRDSVARRRIVN